MKRRAILLGLTSLEVLSLPLSEQIKTALLSHLRDAPLVAAEAVDGLSSLGFTECAKDVEPLLEHESAYVVGAVLHFFSRHESPEGETATYQLAGFSSPNLRQNAIDELDDLRCTEALPQIRRLLGDPDPEVRQAAETAVADLAAVNSGEKGAVDSG